MIASDRFLVFGFFFGFHFLSIFTGINQEKQQTLFFGQRPDIVKRYIYIYIESHWQIHRKLFLLDFWHNLCVTQKEHRILPCLIFTSYVFVVDSIYIYIYLHIFIHISLIQFFYFLPMCGDGADRRWPSWRRQKKRPVSQFCDGVFL